MKKTLLTAFTLALMTSCTEEMNIANVDNEEISYTDEQLEKIAYCGSYTESNDEKVETSASEEYLELVTERLNILEKSGLKSATVNDDNKTKGYVGVIKESDCGQYDEIHIVHNTENRNNQNNRDYYGKNISWTINGNLHMYFCLVPIEMFKQVSTDYAVVNFTNKTDYTLGNNEHTHTLRLTMDSEDNGKGDKIYYKKHGCEEVEDDGFIHSGLTSLDSHKNLILYLVYYERSIGSKNTMPKLGFNYAVFGDFYNGVYGDYTYGTLYSDDEDNKNANTYEHIYKGKVIEKPKGTGPFKHIAKVDDNTRFYFSRIKE